MDEKCFRYRSPAVAATDATYDGRLAQEPGAGIRLRGAAGMLLGGGPRRSE